MSRILHIEASPRADRSWSGKAAANFLARLKEHLPKLEVDRFNIWTAILPSFDGAAIDAKYAKLSGAPLTDAQRRAWTLIGHYVARLDAADAVLISTPMWNLGVPYRLKHLFDLVTQPGLSFSFNPATGYTPLLRPRPTAVLMATSGDFTEGPSYGRPDLATPYLRTALAFVGLKDAAIVHVSPTIGQPEAMEAGVRRTEAETQRLAADFARRLA
jgi:FMN-dependent NADH-azoreductase